MSKRRNEEVFKCQCPVYDCGNTDIIDWHHYRCPLTSNLYINDLAIIRCGKCGMTDEFFSCKYDCGNHFDEKKSARFRSPISLKEVYSFIGALEDDGVYSPDFISRLAESLKMQYRKQNLY